MPIQNLSLRTALRLILSQFDLAHVVKDEVLLITSKTQANSMYETRLYDVRDLVMRDNDPNGTPEFESLIEAGAKMPSGEEGYWQEPGSASPEIQEWLFARV